jgi:hypothetical protein
LGSYRTNGRARSTKAHCEYVQNRVHKMLFPKANHGVDFLPRTLLLHIDMLETVAGYPPVANWQQLIKTQGKWPDGVFFGPSWSENVLEIT